MPLYALSKSTLALRRKRVRSFLFWTICAASLIGSLTLREGIKVLLPLYRESLVVNITGGLKVPISTIVFYADGSRMASSFIENRENMALSSISPWLIKSILTVEDRDFYTHSGFDLKAVVRATLKNIRGRGVVQGGSTVTQQLAKHVISDSSRTLSRKLLELFVAVRLESELSKDKILELYLNRVYFGNGYYGVEAAARGYFGKTAKQLNLEESAMLAGLIRAPSSLNPYKNREKCIDRTNLVLRVLAEQREIPEALPPITIADLHLQPKRQAIIGIKSYPAARAIASAEQLSSLDALDDGLRIYTTINKQLQLHLERLVEHLDCDVAIGLVNLKTGEINAYVGGTDFRKTPYDRFFAMRRDNAELSAPIWLASASAVGVSPATPFPVDAGSATLPLQDILALGNRHGLEALSLISPLTMPKNSSPIDNLSKYQALGNNGVGFNLALLRLVTDVDGNSWSPRKKITNTLPADGTKVAIASMMSIHGLPYFSSSSIGGLDFWVAGLTATHAVIIWTGYDSPSNMSSDTSLMLFKDIVQDSPLLPFPSQLRETYISRATGQPSTNIAGTTKTWLAREIVPTIPEDPWVFSADLSSQLDLEDLVGIIPPASTNYVDAALPSPRPIFITSDGVVIADTEFTLQNFYYWPRLEAFPSLLSFNAWLGQIATFNDAKQVFADRRLLPIPVSFSDVNTQPKPIPVRSYPMDNIYGFITGHVGAERRPRLGDMQKGDLLYPLYKGRDGAEKLLDVRLPLTTGITRFFPDAFGYLAKTEVITPIADLTQLELTIKDDFQQAAYNAMSGIDSGAMVVIDTNDGSVLAMVSKPDYGKSELNKALFFHAPPGSVFKAVTALAGYSKLPGFGLDYTLPIGDVALNGHTFSFPREAGSAPLSEAFPKSFNSFFIRTGLAVGRDNLISTARRLGLGEPTDFALGDISGNIPTNAYMNKIHQRNFGEGDIANFSIGQGDILVTPLQMALVYAAFANKGNLPRPKIFTTEPVIFKPAFSLSDKVWGDMKKLMRDVVLQGTGAQAETPGFQVFGKTGTAQVGSKAIPRNIAWFCGYVERGDDCFSFAIMVEGDSGIEISGGGNAAPILKAFLKRIGPKPSLVKQKTVTPTEVPEAENVIDTLETKAKKLTPAAPFIPKRKGLFD